MSMIMTLLWLLKSVVVVGKVLWSSGEEGTVTMVVGNILGKIATIV